MYILCGRELQSPVRGAPCAPVGKVMQSDTLETKTGLRTKPPAHQTFKLLTHNS